ncbi:GDSL-type esterase/lipase family protein [Weissella confusa]|uniref:GDSL-type esterase/lipase family protein n=1 Tax=Weissella confusa TaxID=1583 RepID=UPI00376EBF8F
MGDTRKQLLMAVLVLSAGGVLAGTSQPVFADTIVPATETVATTQAIEGITAVASTSGQATVANKSGEKTAFAGRNLWALGDSLSVGYDGMSTVPSWSVNLANNMTFDQLYNNHAHSGSQIAGSTSSAEPVHFTKTVSQVINDVNFKAEKQPIVMIELGVNDLNYSSNNLRYVQERLSKNIRTLRTANKDVVIYGILPFANYLGGDFNTIHSGGYSFNQLTDALAEVYTSFNIPVLDWVDYDIDRSPDALGDKTVHPTASTYARMSEIVAEFLDKNANALVAGAQTDKNKYFYSNGWQYNDNDQAQYGLGKGTNGVTQLAAGPQKIAGVTYWFDPKTGVLANRAGEVTHNGKSYYTGADGKLIQGLVMVNDKINYYGNNGTYHKRQNDQTGYLQPLNGGWYWFEKGQLYTGFRSYMGAYYFFINGVRQENKWVSEWGNKYYVGADGRSVQGSAVFIDDVPYDFGTNGTFHLRGAASGYLNGPSGWMWYENGRPYTGFRDYMGAFYYFKKGVRQENKWVSEWGNTYYVGGDGRSVQGNAYMINGVAYDFGNNGTFYKRSRTSGYVYDGSKKNGGYRWYEDGKLFTGFRYYMGTYYWFIDGVRQNQGWRESWGYKYWTDKDGRAVQGWQTIDGKRYFFGDNGTYFLR